VFFFTKFQYLCDIAFSRHLSAHDETHLVNGAKSALVVTVFYAGLVFGLPDHDFRMSLIRGRIA